MNYDPYRNKRHLNRYATPTVTNKAATATELTRKDVKALLSTMAADEHCKIMKLEIRLKKSGIYRVIINVTREKDVNK